MINDIIITRLEDTDIDLLHALMDEFVSSHKSIQYRDNYWHVLRGWLYKIKNDEDFRLLVAKLGEKVIGFVVAQVKDNDPLLLPEKVGFGYIMTVAQEHRKKGVSEALWNAINDWFILRGIKQVETFTLIGNELAERVFGRSMASLLFNRSVGVTLCTDLQ